MRIYLDNCSFNRPYDDQSQLRIRIESEAKLAIQEMIRDSIITLVWSYVLEFENKANPFDDRKNEIGKWRNLASEFIEETEDLINQASSIQASGFKPVDSLHIAAAFLARCDYFVTTDDGILKRSEKVASLMILNPVEFFTKEIK